MQTKDNTKVLNSIFAIYLKCCNRTRRFNVNTKVIELDSGVVADRAIVGVQASPGSQSSIAAITRAGTAIKLARRLARLKF